VFTGIVEELGTVTGLTGLAGGARLTVGADLVTADARHGDSIAVNGVCLTVVEIDTHSFTADLMAETLQRTALGALGAGDQVNLERAATLATRLGGHLVQGHVDGVGTILARAAGDRRSVVGAGPAGPGDSAGEDWEQVRFSLPAGLARYVVEKGSITVDGISLTVMSVGAADFSVGLIPTTLKLTTLGRKGVGDPVNLEVDIVAKYVEKLLAAQGES